MDAQTIQTLNQFEQFFQYQPTWAYHQFIRLPHKVICLFTGNQSMKTSSICYQYVLRILGWHPVDSKNVLYFECENGHTSGVRDLPEDMKCKTCGKYLQIHKRKTRIIRFASENLPQEKETTGLDGSGQSTEIRNASYPELKKWLPPLLIKKDITYRNPAMTILDPNGGRKFGDEVYQGQDIVVEFVSYQQQVQAGAGVQRLSCFCDEEPPMQFWEEQLPRLLAEDGDIILGLTAANRMSWTFDELFERAELYIRTKTIVDFLSTEDKKVKQIEHTDKGTGIAVIQAATDDNPTLPKEVIDQKYTWEDPDTIATRRYGVHRQSTGRIFEVNYQVHVINRSKHFTNDVIPSMWVHARFIDYHERNPWACGWVAISPENEVFVYHEWSPDPTRWVILTICEEMAKISGVEQRYSINLIDPLANKIQTNTGTTVTEDINRVFFELKRDRRCSGGYWEGFDTKGTKGRDNIRERLKNSLLVGKPYNNKVLRDGRTIYLPTLWVTDNCMETARSLKQWRYEEWDIAKRSITNRDKKETPTQKFSHYCTGLEGLLKDERFKPRRVAWNAGGGQRKHNYYQKRA